MKLPDLPPDFDAVRIPGLERMRNPAARPLLARDRLTMCASFGVPVVNPLEAAPSPRQVAGIPFLSERRRLELLLLPRILLQVLENGASDKSHPDYARVQSLLHDAMCEPIHGLHVPTAEKLLRRMQRKHHELAQRYFKDMPNAKVALVLWHMIRGMLDRGDMELYEGSAMADALLGMLPMFEHVMDVEAIDRSAQKQARRFLEALQKEEGLYLPPKE